MFRAPGRRAPLHPREKLLLIVVAAHLVFLPWALGTMHLWSQLVSLGFSCLGLIIALLPRTYPDALSNPAAPFRFLPWPKLIRFPLFWLGLLFLAYILTQALNPAWRYTSDQRGWWMAPLPHLASLPSGVSVPFEKGGPWRMLIIYASAWATVCAAWIGFTRRRSLQLLFTTLATNAFILAIVGIAQRATEADKIFGFLKPPASYFVASFIYKNHAGAYFNLLLTLCAGLALWHYERGLRRLDKSSPSGLFTFFVTAVVLIVVFSYSRTATLLMFGFLLFAGAVFFWRQKRRPGAETRGPLVTGLVLLALASFIYLGLKSLRTEVFLDRMAQLRQQVEETGLGVRELSARATWQMAGDRLVYGWGSGSFQFCFPTYQQKYPTIFNENSRRLYWEHAHNDYAELLAELGLVGTGLIMIMVVYVCQRYLRAGAWRNPVALFAAAGCGLVALHSYVDFQAFNPAILITWCALWILMIRWSELEESRGHG